jgi:O-antigen/teichoic acid export membrane protein
MDVIKSKLYRLLRWSEKYAKTDMVYFFKGNFWLNINRGLNILNGLALSVVFAYVLTKEEYGTYAFAIAFIGIFSMPPTAGLGAGITRGVARGENNVIFEGLRKVMPWAVLAACGLGACAVYYFFLNNHALGLIFFLGALTLPLSVHNSVAKSFLINKGNFDLQTKFSLIRTPIMTIALMSTALFTHSVVAILIVYIVGNIVLGYTLYLRTRKAYEFDHTTMTKEKFSTKFAFHTGILSIFNYLSEQIDNLVLWKFLGAAPVAIFTYARSPIREMRTLLENQSTLVISKFAKKDFEEVRSNISFRIKQMYFLAVPLVIIYILSAPFLFRLLFPQYTGAVAISQLLSLSLLFSPRKLLNAAISSHQKVKESYIMTLLPNTIRIILSISLIYAYGIPGAVIGILISEVIEYVVLGILVRKVKHK